MLAAAENDYSDADDIPRHEETPLEADVDTKEQLNGELLDEVEKTIGKAARAEDEEMEQEDDEEVDANAHEEVEEYVVEAIRGHEIRRGKVLYEVKWKGYAEGDNTLEPEENLMGATQILAKYQHKIGGAPQPSAKKSKSKQSLRAASSQEDSPAPKRQKRKASETEDPEEKSGSWEPKKQDWEPYVTKVDTVERDESGKLMVYLEFKNGKHTKVSMDMIYKHCPRPMLRFYESHL